MSKAIINPFIVAGKIPEKYFCDRRAESRRLIREVTNGNNLVLMSARRMGKTGLIQYCFDKSEIKDRYETFYLDILQTSSLREFTYLLGREIFRRLAPQGTLRLKKFAAILHSISGSFGFDPLSGTPTFNLQIGDIENPEITMEEIFRFLADSETPTIIAIDEFQQIVHYKEKNVEALLRSYIQHLPNSNFIFAGSERHLLREMFAESARPFYNSASVMTLDPIPLDEYQRFAESMFEDSGKCLDKEAVAYTYNLMEGNTFYLQKTFNQAYSGTEDGTTCGLELTKQSIYEILASYDTLYREILSGIGEQQKRLLIAIADAKEASTITSAQFIRSYSLASASSVQSAAKKLIDTGMITRSDNIYRIQDPMLRLWLLDTYLGKSE